MEIGVRIHDKAVKAKWFIKDHKKQILIGSAAAVGGIVVGKVLHDKLVTKYTRIGYSYGVTESLDQAYSVVVSEGDDSKDNAERFNTWLEKINDPARGQVIAEGSLEEVLLESGDSRYRINWTGVGRRGIKAVQDAVEALKEE